MLIIVERQIFPTPLLCNKKMRLKCTRGDAHSDATSVNNDYGNVC